MHYIVGQTVLKGDHTIHLIKESHEGIEIWIEGDGEIYLWKSFTDTMPISIEYNIHF